MSVKELKYNCPETGATLTVVWNGDSLKFKDSILDEEGWLMDRSEAHLLYLYLQEHLGYNKVPTIS